MNSALLQDFHFLLFSFILVSGLFLLSVGRLFHLSRSNSRLSADGARLEKQAVLKGMESTAVHHDAMSWRAKTQRQFEALRSDLSHRLQQSDQGGVHALKAWEEGQQKKLSAAQRHIAELEAALAAKSAAVASRAQDGAEDAQHIQSLESELAAARAEIATGRQQNAVLQRDLLLSRRRAPAPAMRRSGLRSAMRSA